jgi:hypothetical protein
MGKSPAQPSLRALFVLMESERRSNPLFLRMSLSQEKRFTLLRAKPVSTFRRHAPGATGFTHCIFEIFSAEIILESRVLPHRPLNRLLSLSKGATFSSHAGRRTMWLALGTEILLPVLRGEKVAPFDKLRSRLRGSSEMRAAYVFSYLKMQCMNPSAKTWARIHHAHPNRFITSQTENHWRADRLCQCFRGSADPDRA